MVNMSQVRGVDYAQRSQRITWGTRTASGDTCFAGLRTLREARRLKREWDAKFPYCAPYTITRNGVPYNGKGS